MSEKLTLKQISSGYLSVDDLNSNFLAIEQAIDNALTRYTEQPNQMEAELDMNHSKIINVGDPVSATDAANLRTIANYFDNHTFDPDRVAIGQIPHAYLSGLNTGDDHTQYFNTSRGDARYYTQAVSDDRYAYKSHTHLAGDITNLNDGLDIYYLSLANGGTIQSNVTFADTITVGGIETNKLLPIAPNTVFEHRDILLYDTPSEAWYSVNLDNIVTNESVASIFDIDDVNPQDSQPDGVGLAAGQYLRYGSVSGAGPFDWYNSQINYSDIEGTPAIESLPIALMNSTVIGTDSDVGLDIAATGQLMLAYPNSRQWTSLKADTGNFGDVLTVTDNGSGLPVLTLQAIPATVPAMTDLTDVNLSLNTAANKNVLTHNGTSWEYTNLYFSNFAAGSVLTNTQLPITIRDISESVIRTTGTLTVWNAANSDWDVLTPAQIGSPLTSTEHVLTLRANGSVIWTEYEEPSTGTTFSCASLDGCNLKDIGDVSTTNPWPNSILQFNGNEYVPVTVNAHNHSASQITSGTLALSLLPVTAADITSGSLTVSGNTHTHSGYQTSDRYLDMLSSTSQWIPSSTYTSAFGYTSLPLGKTGAILTKAPGSLSNNYSQDTITVINPPTSTGKYLGWNNSSKALQWLTLPTAAGGATTMYQLTDTDWNDNASLEVSADTQMIVWDNTADLWTTRSATTILGDTYVARAGDVMSGTLTIGIGNKKDHALNITSSTDTNLTFTTGMQIDSNVGTANSILLTGATSDYALKVATSASSGGGGIYVNTDQSQRGLFIESPSFSDDAGTRSGLSVKGVYNNGMVINSGPTRAMNNGLHINNNYNTAAIYSSAKSPYTVKLEGTASIASVYADTTLNSIRYIDKKVGFSTNGVVQCKDVIDEYGNTLLGGTGSNDQNLYQSIYIKNGVWNGTTPVVGAVENTLTANSITDTFSLVGMGNISVTADVASKNIYITQNDEPVTPVVGDYVPNEGFNALNGWAGMTGPLLVQTSTQGFTPPDYPSYSAGVFKWNTDDTGINGNGVLGISEVHGSHHGNGGRFEIHNYSSLTSANTAVYAHAEHLTGAAATYGLHGETRHDYSTGSSFAGSFEALSYVDGDDSTSSSGGLFGIKVQAASGEFVVAKQHANSRGIFVHGCAGCVTNEDVGWTKAGMEFSNQSLANGAPAIMLGGYPDRGTYGRHRLYLTPPTAFLGRNNGIGGTYSSTDAKGVYMKANTNGTAIEFYINETIVGFIDANGWNGPTVP